MKVPSHFLCAILNTSTLLLSLFAQSVNSCNLTKRVLITESQCDDAQEAIITNPLFHAALLANVTFEKKLADGTGFRHSTAFTNYFEPSDHPTVSRMFKNIADYTYYRDLRNPSLFLLCSQPDAIPEACQGRHGLVFADPDSRAYSAQPDLLSSGFGFCDTFFDPEEKYVQTFVWSKDHQEWCSDDRKGLSQYWTVGYLTLSLLFTMTEAYGALANIPARWRGLIPGAYPHDVTHGAVMLKLQGNQTPWGAARALKQAWRYAGWGRDLPKLRRVQNADSYAAAATEWYFLTLCGRSGKCSVPNEPVAEGGPWY
ncbi:hypothetical protein EJ08DRAFT_662315 [Tothia fuscella]|uniref:Uncharacterized protein n=1 Tax=Tothia fuscella TaxID=1048955 RepID=A0A9P4NNE5_9PEZI|nr:hypothetical protein EJ08DRAFT_662315 [Tothia fuscella]